MRAGLPPAVIARRFVEGDYTLADLMLITRPQLHAPREAQEQAGLSEPDEVAEALGL